MRIWKLKKKVFQKGFIKTVFVKSKENTQKSIKFFNSSLSSVKKCFDVLKEVTRDSMAQSAEANEYMNAFKLRSILS